MFDVIVIGGGITGAGVLRDCALRGLRCLLLDKGRAGCATTAASTHLIHGGLRYLLYDRLTTHTTCWDSGNIVRIARGLVTRLPIVWPVYRGHRHGLETVETLLESYDGFQRMKLGRPHLRLSAAETLRLLPALAPDGLRGSLVFDEWWVDPVALVRANLDSARRAGAEVREGARVSGLLREGGRVAGVALDGGERLEARLVLNAAGPWVERVAALAELHIPLRLQRGTHLVYPPLPELTASGRPLGLLLEAQGGDRYVFVVPLGREVFVGPTDIAYCGDPDALASTEEEARYLYASARRYLPLPQAFAGTVVGARPILAQAGSEKLLSREYEVLDHEARDGAAGFATIAGGKLSDFRLMAQDAADLACRRLGKGEACRTSLERLDGSAVGAIPYFPPPPRLLKRFLRRHPRLRELHALGHLGVQFARHLAGRALGGLQEASLEDFQRHYGQEPEPLLENPISSSS
ncbi:MAG: FAD-dependent oxidoreductase [Elusimicrobia bacterium]|nr:FAD-dependent oxidoreductase [Elusimicrobiota bacterium]